MNSQLLNGVTLAFIGDAYYGLEIKKYLVQDCEITHAQTLQNKLTFYVRASAQATIVQQFLVDKLLTADEENIFKRGRNAKTNSKPKNADVITYKLSTGFEAVLGWLVLENNEERADVLIQHAIKIIEGAETI